MKSSRIRRVFGAIIFAVAISLPVILPERGGSQTETGTLAGTVELHNTSRLIRREPGVGYGGGASMEMRHAESGSDENENVVVYLVGNGLEKFSRTRPDTAVMDQKNTTFIPHVLPVLKGTIVDFVNEDKVYHNVFSLSSIKRFDIGRRPTGEVVPVRFNRTGVAEIFCDIHSYMSAFILVLGNSFFVKPDARGYFKIDNIPPGTYVMKVWHERLHSPNQTVTITAGKTTTVHPVLE